jgi:hypothetical protein
MANEAQVWQRMGTDILEAPNSDDLRLRFAAALDDGEAAEEREGDRARFIFVQVALASMAPSDPEWMRLASEAESLLLDHEGEWMPKWYEAAGIRDPEFHRGFIECVTVSASALREFQDNIFTQSPVRHLDIVELGQPKLLEAALFDLEKNRYLDRLVSLRLDGQHLENEHMEYLNRPSLSGLRWLSLTHNSIGYEGAAALTQGNLRNLEFVDLYANPFDPVEQLMFDQGIVIERSSDHVPKEFPEASWLRRRISSGLLFHPSRFETIHGYTDDDLENGSSEEPGGSNRQDGGRGRARIAQKRGLRTA